jgi:hypothetical protein
VNVLNLTGRTIALALLLACACAWGAGETGASQERWLVGAARVDITPDYPVVLSGYLKRQEESQGVLQHIYAKAIAIGSDAEGPAVLISADNCGLPSDLRRALLQSLAKAGIKEEKLAICVSHTHAAPKLTGSLDNLFGADIPADRQERINRYTAEFLDNLEKAALQALKNRQPAHLQWGQSTAGFAMNRRVPAGPVDHDLPLLQVTDADGQTIVVVTSYACHCTTLGPENPSVCGDWAGYAQEAIEREFPGAIALTLMGCGAECNPFPRADLAHAKVHGETIAQAVKQRAAAGLAELSAALECRTKWIQLPFDTLPTRQEFETLARRDDPTGYNARKYLARIDHGEPLPKTLPYLVQTWRFGSNEMIMVFLPGEVVADYSLRLKDEFDRRRLWVNAYANDVPCYIPSRRVWKMHGYEADLSMVYYNQPTRLGGDIEDRIMATAHELIPGAFASAQRQRSPAEKANLRLYLLMGQSNMEGRGTIEAQDRSPHPRVFVLTASNRWDLAVEPLFGIGPGAGIGPGLAFGKAMGALNTNLSIGLIPCAVGATELKRWERGGDLYRKALARAQAAQRDGTLDGVLWHQGEQDSMYETNAVTYGPRLIKMIADFRSDLGQPTLPFVAGQIGEFLYTRKKQQTPFAKGVNNALAKIPSEVPHTACVSSLGLGHRGDEVHFDGRSQRELGKRYAAAMHQLQIEPAAR